MGELQLPRRRLQLKLDLQADDLRELAGALTALAIDLEIEGREQRDITSGGSGSGYHLTLTCDESMNHDRYVVALHEYVAHKRSARAGASHG